LSEGHGPYILWRCCVCGEHAGDQSLIEHTDECVQGRMLKAMALTPPAALAALRQKIRVEVLEATALLAEAEGDCYAFPDQGKPTTSECFRLFTHKIRAMKEEK